MNNVDDEDEGDKKFPSLLSKAINQYKAGINQIEEENPFLNNDGESEEEGSYRRSNSIKGRRNSQSRKNTNKSSLSS